MLKAYNSQQNLDGESTGSRLADNQQNLYGESTGSRFADSQQNLYGKSTEEGLCRLQDGRRAPPPIVCRHRFTGHDGPSTQTVMTARQLRPS